MATDLATLVRRTRRFVRDVPDYETHTASLSSTATTLTVVDSTKYRIGGLVELDYETMVVRALPSGTTLTVTRGALDSTAASHAAATSILRDPAFTFAEYRDALNAGLDASFPLLYKEVVDESLTVSVLTYEYTVPNMPGSAYDGASIPIPYLSYLAIKESGDSVFREKRDWKVIRGATPKVVFRRAEPSGMIRLRGYGPFPYLTAATDTLDAQFPPQAVRALSEFAGQWLLASGEAGRVRAATGVQDAREQANKVGSSMGAANALLSRFEQTLRRVAPPPMGPHVVATF